MAETNLDTIEPETAQAESLDRITPRGLPGASISLTASLALAACSGGGGGVGTTAAGSPVPTSTPLTPAPIAAAAASRLLGQATMGATKADITSVQSLGFEGWLRAK